MMIPRTLLFGALALLIASPALAGSQTLTCSVSEDVSLPVGGPRFEIVRKGESYSLKQIPLNPTAKAASFKLEVISGDEGYNEYQVLDPKNRTSIEFVTIGEDFDYATLSNEDGDSTHDCN